MFENFEQKKDIVYSCENPLEMLHITLILYYTLDLIRTISVIMHPTFALSFCLLDSLNLLQILELDAYNQINLILRPLSGTNYLSLISWEINSNPDFSQINLGDFWDPILRTLGEVLWESNNSLVLQGKYYTCVIENTQCPSSACQGSLWLIELYVFSVSL